MGFWQILGDIGIVAGIASSIATLAAYFTTQSPLTKQRFKLVGVPLALILIVAGVLSLWYSVASPAGNVTGNGRPSPSAIATTGVSRTATPGTTATATNTGTPTTTVTTTGVVPTTHTLVRAYKGTITDEDALNTTSDMFLCAVVQSGNNITGEVKLTLFSGSGPFTGTIGSDSRVQFSITNADDGYGPSDFNGFLRLDGSMSGQYINHSLNHHGTWQVFPDEGNVSGGC
jgi:hypothetical protein